MIMEEGQQQSIKKFWDQWIQGLLDHLPMLCLLISAFSFGLAIGFHKNTTLNNQDNSRAQKITRRNYKSCDMESTYMEQLLGDLKAENIEKNLKNLTKRVHMAGSARNNELGEMIRKAWASYRFDKVEKVKYEVLLSYPGTRNSLRVLSPGGKLLKTFYSNDKIVESSEDDPERIPPYIAFSRSGNVSGELVYANFGRPEDFEYLRQLGISGKGKIALVRYGIMYRGHKVIEASKYGFSGVILYNDPDQTAPLGEHHVYPEKQWLPLDSVQMGTIKVEDGDLLTPNLPAIEGVFRNFSYMDMDKYIPSIVLPTSDVIEIMKQMQEPKAPHPWQSKLPLTYHIGPGYHVRLQVHNKLVTRPIYNIIGTIYGKDEPDRLVLLGNHRDAWQFGGVDPSSGTAVLLEVARGLSNLRKKGFPWRSVGNLLMASQGWVPRRTIMLCSWDAEEFGLIGSTEWVEDNEKLLIDRAVFYLNMDYAVQGNWTFQAQGSPAVRGLLYEETKRVFDPNSQPNKSESMYDIWKQREPSTDEEGRPFYGDLDGASDFVGFQQYAGVPSTNIRYMFKSHNVSYYPVYHTIHDTFAWVKKFVDPNFLFHLTMGKLACRLVLKISDSILLPFNVSNYSDEIAKRLSQFKRKWGASLERKNISLNYVEEAVRNFTEITRKFEEEKRRFKGDCCRARILNDQMFKVEKTFLAANKGRTRNIIFGTAAHVNYGNDWFTGILDALHGNDKSRNTNNNIKLEVSLVYQAMRSAIRHLEVVNFPRKKNILK